MSKFLNRLLIVSLLGLVSSYLVRHEPKRLHTRQLLNSGNSTKADKLFDEGRKLHKEGTKKAKQQALTKYEQALKLYQVTGDKKGQAFTLANIGRVYSDLDQKQKALEHYNQALPIFKAVGERSGEATLLSSIGLVYLTLDQYQKAEDYFNQALSLTRTIKDRSGEAATLINLGGLYSNLGEKRKALDYYNQALPIFRTVGNRSAEAITLNNIGSVYNNLGENQKALDYYHQALPINRAVGDRSGEATTLNNIGAVYNDLSENQKALDYYHQALSIFTTVGNRSGEATTLGNLGDLYSNLGEDQKALEYYNQALPIFRTVESRGGEVGNLISIGSVYHALGENQKAKDYFNQALSLTRAIGSRRQEATTLTHIGVVYSDLGEKQKALEYYNQALSLTRAIESGSEDVITLTGIGMVYSDLGEKQKAKDYFNQVLSLTRAAGNRDNEAYTLFNLARLQRSQNNLNQALTNINSAIDIIEDLRVKIVNPDLRTSYFATFQDYYQLKIDLLMQLHKQQPNQGYNIQALETSESAKARGLLDLLKEAKANIKEGVAPELLEQERHLQQRLKSLEKQRLELLNKNQSVPDSLEQEIKNLNQQYDNNQDQIRLTSPRYAALTQPKPLKLAAIQHLLDNDTIILEYSLGKDHSYFWLITKNSLNSYEIPKSVELKELASHYHSLLAVPGGKYSDDPEMLASNQQDLEKTGSKLAQILLNPVADQLSNKRLVIVAEGALQFIPFGALPFRESKQPLIMTNEVINIPSASTLALLQQPKTSPQKATKTVAIFANPVFSINDPRLSSTIAQKNKQPVLSTEIAQRSLQEYSTNLAPLPYTKEEAKAIKKLVSPQQEKIFLDFEANLANVTSSELVNYRILHVATHGIIDTQEPKKSRLVFSRFNAQGKRENGDLNIGDIFNLKLTADLVVLSACETGLAKEIKGEGLVGITRGFMYAGSPRVVVSLWEVNDQATSILMAKFYAGILKQGLTPAQSLRRAQQELRKDPKYQAPYYWAPFILQGEWK